MSDTSPHGVSVTHKEIKQSHSMAVQDKEKQFNPEEEDSQSTVSQDHVRPDICRLIKDIVTGSESLTVHG
jgi:hypothetical protein